uniref:Uncharacterized protein n=1 Tax=Glossina morsitans morsitans TaxID=37546 RepID=A0A1B0G4Y5_GLOMM
MDLGQGQDGDEDDGNFEAVTAAIVGDIEVLAGDDIVANVLIIVSAAAAAAAAAATAAFVAAVCCCCCNACD